MIREEAIKGLQRLSKEFGGYKPNEEMFEMAIEALQEQKTGKWIREVLGSTSGYGTTIMYQCTNCEKMSISKYKFCPNCGTRME